MEIGKQETPQRKSQAPVEHYQHVPPLDPWVVQQVWEQWEPERPELFVRFRPRRTTHAAQ